MGCITSALVRGHQRTETSRGQSYRYRRRSRWYRHESAHTVTGGCPVLSSADSKLGPRRADGDKFWSGSQQAQDQRRAGVSSPSLRAGEDEASPLALPFCYIQVFGCWPGSHPNREGHLFTQSEDSDANPIRNTLPDTPRVMFAPDSGGPSKVIHKIDHHDTQAKTQGDPRDPGELCIWGTPSSSSNQLSLPNSNLCLPGLPTEFVGYGAKWRSRLLFKT